MPRKGKINLDKIKASLSIACTKCGYGIEPAELKRIDTEHIRCPKCGAAFVPASKKKSF